MPLCVLVDPEEKDQMEVVLLVVGTWAELTSTEGGAQGSEQGGAVACVDGVDPLVEVLLAPVGAASQGQSPSASPRLRLE